MQIRNRQFFPSIFEPNARARSIKKQISTDLHPVKVGEKKEIESFNKAKSAFPRYFYEPKEPDNGKLAQILSKKFNVDDSRIDLPASPSGSAISLIIFLQLPKWLIRS